MKGKIIKALLKFLTFQLIAVLMLWLIPVGSVFGEGNKEYNIEALEVAIEEAAKVLEESKEALDSANKLLDDAQAKADEANKILSRDEVALQEAEARLYNAKTRVSEAENALACASEGDDIESLEANLLSARDELQSAQKAYDDAVAALEEARANADQAQLDLDQAKLAIDEANINLETAQKAYDDAVVALEKAKKNSEVSEDSQDNNQNNDENNNGSNNNGSNGNNGNNSEGNNSENSNSNEESGNTNEEPGSNENLTLLAVNSSNLVEKDLEINPSISTDKDDYSPGETVVISGTGFYLDTEYTLRVTRPDGAKDTATVTSDSNGSFTYNYQLDGITGEYLVEAIDGEGSILTSYKFTDTETCEDTKVDLHQAHQGADSSTFTPDIAGDNGGITTPGVVWHFILNGLDKDTPPATLYISFVSAGSSTVTASNGGKTQHFWVWTPTDDKLAEGQVYALVDSCGYNNLVLSHVCHNGDSSGGTIIVTKSGMEEGDLVSVSLYKGSNLIKTETDVSNGVYTFSGLDFGNDYSITEVYNSGNTYTYATATQNPSNPLEISSSTPVINVSLVNNPEKCSITITKKDATDGSVLAGSTFRLFEADGITPAKDVWGNPLANQVSDASGMAYFTNIAIGTYVVKEVGAPIGYVLADPVTVIVGGESGLNVAIEIRDPRIPGSITITKINSSTGRTTMSGVGFTIYYKASGNPVYPEAFTNDSGLVTFAGLPWGTYTIAETSPPSGFTPAGPVDITKTKDNAATGVAITVSNTPIPLPPPPSPPPPTPTPTTTPTVTVAGVATPFLEVLGISELPFTGLHPAIPIAGSVLILAGAILLVLTIRRKQRKLGEEKIKLNGSKL